MLSSRCVAYWSLTAGVLLLVFFSANGASAQMDEVFKLPEFEVRDSRPTYYVTIPGYEILSLVGPKETAEFVNRLRRESWILSELMPRGRRVGPPVRATIVLQSKTLARMKASQVDGLPETTKFRKLESASELTIGLGYPPKWIRAWQTEEDTFTVFSEFSPKGVAAEDDVHSRSELQATLIWLAESRMLRVPRWYRDWAVKSLSRGNLTDVSPTEATWTVWWKQFNPKPLGRFFSEIDNGMPGTETQVAAFVNWGIWAETGRRREAFLKFVDAAARRPVTESLFREAFGIDFSEADPAFKEMADHNHERMERLRRLDGKVFSDVRSFDVALATPGQVAAIMGAVYIAEGTPVAGRAARPELLERARQLLLAVEKSGDHDPRVLATLGFLELASNDRAAAEKYFEGAVAARIVRPRVYLELARIRYAKAVTEAKSSAWDDATVAAVLQPLLIAQMQLPEMQATYELLVEIEARRQSPPPTAEIDLLKENVWGDSGAMRLVWKTALLLAKNGFVDEAVRLIEATLSEPVIPGATKSAFLLGGGPTISRGTISAARPVRSPPSNGRAKLTELLQQLRTKDDVWMTSSFDELDDQNDSATPRP